MNETVAAQFFYVTLAIALVGRSLYGYGRVLKYAFDSRRNDAPPESKRPSTSTPFSGIPQLGSGRSETLRRHGIPDIASLSALTKDDVSVLASALRLPEDMIEAWRDAATGILRGEPKGSVRSRPRRKRTRTASSASIDIALSEADGATHSDQESARKNENQT